MHPQPLAGKAEPSHEREARRLAEEVALRPAGTAGGPCGGAAPGGGRPSDEGSWPPSVPPALRRLLPGRGRPLDDPERRDMETHFGRDLGSVRIHDDDAAARSASLLGAEAYTVGRHVVFGRGRRAPGSDGGRRLLAHEVTHVLQQGAPGATKRVQRQEEETRPRLAETTARRDPLDRHILVFSDLVTLERAMGIVWPGGFHPTLEVFHPDHGDPWADRDRGRYQRFVFDYGNPTGRPDQDRMWAEMRPEVRAQYGGAYQEQPEVGGRDRRAPLFPDWVPERVRHAVLTGEGLGRRSRNRQVGIMASSRGRRWPLLVWRRATPQGDVHFALEGLFPDSLAYYRRQGFSDGTARLIWRALRGWNADMIELVYQHGVEPRRARQILEHRARVNAVIGLLELYSYMIPARFGAAPGAGSVSGTEASLSRYGRRIAREFEAAHAAPEVPSTLPPERAPTLPAERAPTLPVERAPTLPAERAPTLPVEEAPTLPPEHAPTLPAERGPTLPAERGPAPRPEPGAPPPAELPEPPGRPAIPPPAPEHPPAVPEIPRPPRVPSELEGTGPASSSRPPPEAGPEPTPRVPVEGTRLSPVTLEQARRMWVMHGDTPMSVFFGEGAGARHYQLHWEQMGGTGAAPPFGFWIRDAAGRVMEIVYYWASHNPPPRR